MPSSIIASPARVLTDITQSYPQQHRHNRSHHSPSPSPPTTPQKASRPSPPPLCRPQTASAASPPSSSRQPPAAFSSPASTRRVGTDQLAAVQTADSFTQWMDAVLPLVHSTSVDEQPDEEAVEPERAVDDASLQPYVTINPALLHDSRWAYRDLQLLCQRLGLGGRGDRLHLIHKLRTWNRTHFSSYTTQPITAAASNFALLCINSGGNKYAAQLTPLKVKTPRLCDGSPRSALTGGRGAVVGGVGSEGRRLSFSVFNGVKIIPPRTLHYEDDEKDEREQDEEKKREQSTAEQAKQSETTKGGTTVELSCDASKQQSKCATAVSQSVQPLKSGDESGEQAALKQLISPSLRRSDRKRLPSRKARESRL